MHITKQQLEPVLTALAVNTFKPPREAVAALMVLGGPSLSAQDLASSASWAKPGYKGRVEWNLIAQSSDGIAVVRATAGEHLTWTTTEEDIPPDLQVRARLTPWRSLKAVGVADVTLYDVATAIRDNDLIFKHRWILEIEGAEPVSLVPDDSEGSADRLAGFVARLRAGGFSGDA